MRAIPIYRIVMEYELLHWKARRDGILSLVEDVTAGMPYHWMEHTVMAWIDGGDKRFVFGMLRLYRPFIVAGYNWKYYRYCKRVLQHLIFEWNPDDIMYASDLMTKWYGLSRTQYEAFLGSDEHDEERPMVPMDSPEEETGAELAQDCSVPSYVKRYRKRYPV